MLFFRTFRTINIKLVHEFRPLKQKKYVSNDPIFHEKLNQPGKGTPYETVAPAFFALRLYIDPKIVDFEIEFNQKTNSKFDDVVIAVTLQNSEKLYFAIQLKHAEKEKLLKPPSFVLGKKTEVPGEYKGEFVLNMYCKSVFCESVKCSDNDCKFLHLQKVSKTEPFFILYTCRPFDENDMNYVDQFDMLKHDKCKGANYFNTSTNCSVYKFSTNESTVGTLNVKREHYERFFNKFSFYSGQHNCGQMREAIEKIFKNEFKSDRYNDYITFMEKCHDNEFEDRRVTREMIRIQLTNILLKPSTLILKDTVFRQIVQQFDLTAIDEPFEDFCKIWCSDCKTIEASHNFLKIGKSLKIIESKVTTLTAELKQQILWYFSNEPIVVEYDSKRCIVEKLSWCRGINSFVLVGIKVDSCKFPDMKVFRNLQDVFVGKRKLYNKLVNLLQILVRKDKSICLKYLLKDNKELLQYITTEDLLKMLLGDYCVEEKVVYKKSENYIPREISTIVINTSSLSLIDDDILVINYSTFHQSIFQFILGHGKGITFLQLRKICQQMRNVFWKNYGLHQQVDLPSCIKTKKIKSFSAKKYNEMEKTIRIVTIPDSECHEENYKIICHFFPQRNVHFFKALNKTHLQWITSKGDCSQLRKCTFEEIFTEEVNIFDKSKNKLNLICGLPGLGKTELLKNLKENCPLDVLTVFVKLTKHKSVFKSENNIDILLNHFLDVRNGRKSNERIKEVLKKKKLIAFFFDGFDELRNEEAQNAKKCIQQIQEQGFYVWVSSRNVCKEDLESTFNVLGRNIKPFSEKQQLKYMKQRLINEDQVDVEKFIENIFGSNEPGTRNLLSLPLTLFMITETFGQPLRQNFVITDMYHCFLESNYKHYLRKEEFDDSQPVFRFAKNYCWQQYEKAALASCLDASFIQELNVSYDSYYKEFVEEIKNNERDPLGIIETVEDGRPSFTHQTNAEFFVAIWIAKNYQNIKNLKKFIFDEKYTNIRFFLDLELANRDSLFLAVIYKNLKFVVTYQGTFDQKDKGGRTILHIASSYGLQFANMDQNLNGEEILEKLLTHLENNLDQEDDLHHMTPIEYANETNCLLQIEILKGNGHGINRNLSNYIIEKMYNLIEFVITNNLANILKKIIDNNSVLVQDFLEEKKSCWHKAIARNCIDVLKLLLNFIQGDIEIYPQRSLLYLAIKEGSLDITSLLIRRGCKIQDSFNNGFSPLQLSVAQGHLEITKFLITNGATINDIHNGLTPLHFAVLRNRVEIVKLLIEKGADVNITCVSDLFNLQLSDHIIDDMLEGFKWKTLVDKIDKMSPLDLAFLCRTTQIENILKKQNAISVKKAAALQNSDLVLSWQFLGRFLEMLGTLIRSPSLLETKICIEYQKSGKKPDLPKFKAKPRKQKRYNIQQMPKQRRNKGTQ